MIILLNKWDVAKLVRHLTLNQAIVVRTLPSQFDVLAEMNPCKRTIFAGDYCIILLLVFSLHN